MDNRRESPRIPLITMARITPHGLQTTVGAFVRDVSTGGIGLYAKGRYQKGDIILLKILLVTEEGEAIKESLTGRIVWVKRMEEEGQSAVGVELPEMERKHPKLYAYIKRLEERN